MAKKITIPKPKLTDVDREAACEAIPQKLWRQWSGRQWKTLSEQSRLYGFPMGATISLPEFVLWFHNFLAENARKLNAKPTRQRDDVSPAMERWRQERAEMAELQKLKFASQLIAIDDVETFQNKQAELLRRASDRLEKRYDAGTARILSDAIDDLEKWVDDFENGNEEQDDDANE